MGFMDKLTDMLESPDKIFPGQELVIPDLEES
jgi:nucleoid-associated protein YgaU